MKQNQSFNRPIIRSFTIIIALLALPATGWAQNVFVTNSSAHAVPVTVSGGGGAVSVADGSDVAEGATTDAAVTAGAAGSISAKLRLLTNLNLTQGSTTASQTGPLLQGAVLTAAPAYTTAQTSPLSLTTSGSLRVDLASANSTNLSLNGGISAAGTIRVVIATDGPGINTTGSAVNARGVYDTGIAKTTQPANSTDGNAVGMLMDHIGRVVTTPGQMREFVGKTATTITASSTETTIVAAVASTFNDLSTLIVSSTIAVANTITIRDGTGGTIVAILDMPAGASTPGAPPIVIPFHVPMPQAAVNTNWTAQCSSATGATHITAVYLINK